MLVPDRGVDELRREVEVALPVVVPEVASLGAGDGKRARSSTGSTRSGGRSSGRPHEPARPPSGRPLRRPSPSPSFPSRFRVSRVQLSALRAGMITSDAAASDSPGWSRSRSCRSDRSRRIRVAYRLVEPDRRPRRALCGNGPRLPGYAPLLRRAALAVASPRCCACVRGASRHSDRRRDRRLAARAPASPRLRAPGAPRASRRLGRCGASSPCRADVPRRTARSSSRSRSALLAAPRRSGAPPTRSAARSQPARARPGASPRGAAPAGPSCRPAADRRRGSSRPRTAAAPRPARTARCRGPVVRATRRKRMRRS